MLARRRFALVPSFDCLSSRIAPSTLAVTDTSSTDSTTDVTTLDSSQTTVAVDTSQTDDPDYVAPSPVDFDWTPFCAVEDYPPVSVC